MINLLHLWVVHYKLESGRNVKCKFFTFDCNGIKLYKIVNESLGVNKEVTKEYGNNYYLELFKIDKEAIVNKIC